MSRDGLAEIRERHERFVCPHCQGKGKVKRRILGTREYEVILCSKCVAERDILWLLDYIEKFQKGELR